LSVCTNTLFKSPAGQQAPGSHELAPGAGPCCLSVRLSAGRGAGGAGASPVWAGAFQKPSRDFLSLCTILPPPGSRREANAEGRSVPLCPGSLGSGRLRRPRPPRAAAPGAKHRAGRWPRALPVQRGCRDVGGWGMSLCPPNPSRSQSVRAQPALGTGGPRWLSQHQHQAEQRAGHPRRRARFFTHISLVLQTPLSPALVTSAPCPCWS